MAAEHADSMRSLGLHGLAPSEVFRAFAEAGYAPRGVRAGIAASRFRAVNTAKGPWSFLRQLAAVPAVSQARAEPASAAAPALLAGQEQYGAEAAAAAAVQQPALSEAEVWAQVQAAAEEVVGADGLEAGGRFAPGAFDSLAAVELSNSLGKVPEHLLSSCHSLTLPLHEHVCHQCCTSALCHSSCVPCKCPAICTPIRYHPSAADSSASCKNGIAGSPDNGARAAGHAGVRLPLGAGDDGAPAQPAGAGAAGLRLSSTAATDARNAGIASRCCCSRHDAHGAAHCRHHAAAAPCRLRHRLSGS
jgi:hypothetical protein